MLRTPMVTHRNTQPEDNARNAGTFSNNIERSEVRIQHIPSAHFKINMYLVVVLSQRSSPLFVVDRQTKIIGLGRWCHKDGTHRPVPGLNSSELTYMLMILISSVTKMAHRTAGDK
jgi:hypothetical protein